MQKQASPVPSLNTSLPNIKERYGLRRTRFLGLLMNACHAGLAALAHTLKKGTRFYQLYGLPEPQIAG